MTKLKMLIIARAILAVLCVAAAMNAQEVSAQQGPPDGLAVRVVNVPIPVTGVTLDISKSASNIVELHCGATAPGQFSTPCILVTPGAANGGEFVVPAGHKFVITSVDVITGFVTPGVTNIRFLQSPSGSHVSFIREGWVVSNASPMTQLQFPSGIVIDSDFRLLHQPFTDGNSNPVSLAIHGYLSPN